MLALLSFHPRADGAERERWIGAGDGGLSLDCTGREEGQRILSLRGSLTWLVSSDPRDGDRRAGGSRVGDSGAEERGRVDAGRRIVRLGCSSSWRPRSDVLSAGDSTTGDGDGDGESGGSTWGVGLDVDRTC